MKYSLVVLVFALGGVPAAASVLRSSDTTLTVEGAPSPWLSLLASSWSLAGSPNPTGGLEQLEQQLLALARSNNFAGLRADPQMASAVSMVRDLINQMMASVNRSNIEAQAMLWRLWDEFSKCKQPNVSTAVDLNAVNESVTQLTQVCLPQLRNLINISVNCKDRLKYCLQEKPLCCTPLIQKVPNCQYPPPAPPTGICEGKSQCSDSDLNNVATQMDQLVRQFDDAADACAQSQQTCHAQTNCDVESFNTKYQTWKCSEVENDIELRYCQVAQYAEGNWSAYSACYDLAQRNIITARTCRGLFYKDGSKRCVPASRLTASSTPSWLLTSPPH